MFRRTFGKQMRRDRNNFDIYGKEADRIRKELENAVLRQVRGMAATLIETRNIRK